MPHFRSLLAPLFVAAILSRRSQPLFSIRFSSPPIFSCRRAQRDDAVHADDAYFLR
jgi:hypothetical protein